MIKMNIHWCIISYGLDEDNKIGDINKEDYISMTLFDIGSSYLILAAVILYQSRNDGGRDNVALILILHSFFHSCSDSI